MDRHRVEKIQVVVIVNSYTPEGHLSVEQPTEPIIFYRATTPDVWEKIDSMLPSQE